MAKQAAEATASKKSIPVEETPKNRKAREKVEILKNSTGISNGMLPRRTKKALAIYQMINLGEVDPLTGQEADPAPVIIPSTYTLYDKFEPDLNKRNKVMKLVESTEFRLNPTTNLQEKVEIFKELLVLGGSHTVNIHTRFNEFIFLELHPFNESNPFRRDYPNIGPALFRRVDKDIKNTREQIAEDDLRLDAQMAVRKMGLEEAKAHALAMNMSIMDKKTDDIKWDLRVKAKENPREFLSTHPSKEIRVRLMVLDALQLGIIDYSEDGRKFRLFDEKVPFFTAQLNKDAETDLINHLVSKEGQDDLDELIRLMET